MNQHAAQPHEASGIVVRNATVTYRNGHTALRDANFTAPAGSITALVGINGSGKSTLFKAIMGFVGLARGDIKLGFYYRASGLGTLEVDTRTQSDIGTYTARYDPRDLQKD